MPIDIEAQTVEVGPDDALRQKVFQQRIGRPAQIALGARAIDDARRLDLLALDLLAIICAAQVQPDRGTPPTSAPTIVAAIVRNRPAAVSV
jgi:hypothetical protein